MTRDALRVCEILQAQVPRSAMEGRIAHALVSEIKLVCAAFSFLDAHEAELSAQLRVHMEVAQSFVDGSFRQLRHESATVEMQAFDAEVTQVYVSAHVGRRAGAEYPHQGV